MRIRRIVLIGAAALLVVALAAPAAAAPKNKKAGGPTLRDAGAAQAQGPSSDVTKAKAERLKDRVEQTLRVRKQRFDRAEQRFADYVLRGQALADKVSAAGGDVSAAEAALAGAEASLAEAATLEAQAVDQFKAVPEADDPRAAFKAARETAKAAAAELRAARKDVHEAVQLLREQLRALAPPDGVEDES